MGRSERLTGSVSRVSEFVVITGVSGAGRTQFGDSLEDLGWFVIDNIPVELIPKVAELARFKERGTPVALVVGSGGDLAEIGPALDELRGSSEPEALKLARIQVHTGDRNAAADLLYNP